MLIFFWLFPHSMIADLTGYMHRSVRERGKVTIQVSMVAFQAR